MIIISIQPLLEKKLIFINTYITDIGFYFFFFFFMKKFLIYNEWIPDEFIWFDSKLTPNVKKKKNKLSFWIKKWIFRIWYIGAHINCGKINVVVKKANPHSYVSNFSLFIIHYILMHQYLLIIYFYINLFYLLLFILLIFFNEYIY